VEAGGEGLGKKTRLLRCHFVLKMMILPRQARDKHRESTQTKWRFLAGMYANDYMTGYLMAVGAMLALAARAQVSHPIKLSSIDCVSR
jgi:hypothetical protein